MALAKEITDKVVVEAHWEEVERALETAAGDGQRGRTWYAAGTSAQETREVLMLQPGYGAVKALAVVAGSVVMALMLADKAAAVGVV
jgi:transposase